LNPTGFTSILCPVDFSLQSYAALQTAAHIAHRNGGRLTALYVEDPLIGAAAAASGYNVSLLRKSTLTQLDRLMDRIAAPAGLTREAWHVETLLGKPARTIMAVAKKISADLIVMGTNGRTGPAKLFFGSVADAVLRHAPAPLLVVSRRRPPVDLRTRRRPMIGAIELGEHDRADARRMATAADMLGGQMTLVHVVHRSSDVPTISYYEPQLKAARKRLDSVAKRVNARGRVLLGKPEDEIAAAATGAKADLIILALRRGRGIFGPRQGATTYRLLCSSTTPVLALPPTWDG
jgi:universal stress protein A